MDKEKIKIILDNLHKDERIEKDFIEIYLCLLDMGVENCFPEKYNESIRNGLTTLIEDSRYHEKKVKELIDYYQE